MSRAYPSDLARIAAQRNAAVAVVLLLTGAVICAGWALEVFPRRTAAAYGGENASLRAGLSATEKALSDTQKTLVSTQAALGNTEQALANTQEALKQAQKSSR
jgi:CII-binding regulator of phage lambda lysogenization HflD